jgi:copper chaperone CopZ/gas vesicle protein
MKSIILMAAVILLPGMTTQSQINNPVTETVKVYGNCGMCEDVIEKASSKKKVSTTDWNKDSKMAVITYDSKKTTLDAVLKNIALAGYDNQSFLAPDDAYNKLPECCRYDREKKQVAIMIQPVKDTTAPVQNHAGHQHDGMNNPAQETNQLKAVFDSYFSLKDALVKTDGNAASSKAKELQTAINSVKMDKLSMNVHTAWMKVLNDLKEDAEHINGTKDIAHQRDHFMSLSKNIYELIKIAKPAETVYYQFCPMANNGKGANWLSRESGIKNPYYGSQMLTCGKTVETISQQQ